MMSRVDWERGAMPYNWQQFITILYWQRITLLTSTEDIKFNEIIFSISVLGWLPSDVEHAECHSEQNPA